MKTKIIVLLLFFVSSLLLAQTKGATANKIENDEEETGTTRALIIGISKYNSIDYPDLEYTDNDAYSFNEWLLSDYGKIKSPENIKLLMDENASREKILGGVLWTVQKSKPGDKVIIYFSGHGDVAKIDEENGTGFFIPYGVPRKSASDLFVNGFPVDQMVAFINMLLNKKVKVILVADACRSGSALDSKGARQLNRAIKEGGSGDFLVFVSSSSKQYSFEGPQWANHGAFTYYFLKGVYGLADADSNSVVDSYELIDYIKESLENDELDQRPSLEPEDEVELSKIDEKSILIAKNYTPLDDEKILALKSSNKDVNFKGGVKAVENNLAQVLQLKINDFRNAIYNKNLLPPGGDNAYSIIKQINEIDSNIAQTFEIDLMISLIDSSTQIINKYLEGSDELPPSETFLNSSMQIKYARELYASKDYFDSTLIAKQNFLEAYSYIRANRIEKYDIAENLLKTAISIEPDAAYTRNALGIVYNDIKKLKLAEEQYTKAIELMPKWIFPHNNLANNYRDMNNLTKALETYEFARTVDSTYPTIYNNLGTVYSDLGMISKANDFYTIAIELDSAESLPYVNLGINYRDQGRFREAEELMLKSFQVTPDNYFGTKRLAYLYTYKEVRNPKKAEDLYKKAIELEPYYASSYTGLADFYRQYTYTESQLEEAKNLYKKAIEVQKYYSWSYAGLGWLFIKKEMYDSAKVYFELGTELNPESAESWNYLGDFYENRNDSVKAEECYKKSLALNKYYIDSYENLSELYEKQKRFDEAEKILLRYFELVPLSTKITYGIANYYLRREEFVKAEEFFSKTIEIDPNNAYSYSALATLLLTEDYKINIADASNYFDKAIQLNPFQNKPEQFSKILSGIASKSVNNELKIEAYEASLMYENNNLTRLNYGKFLYIIGETDKADEVIDENNFEQITGQFQINLMNLNGLILIDKGNFSEAEKLFTQINNNSFFPSFIELAVISYKSGNKEKALELLKKHKKYNPAFKINSGSLESEYSSLFVKVVLELANE